MHWGNVIHLKKINGISILKTESKITRLISPYMDKKAEKTTKFDVKYNEDYSEAKITFEKKLILKAKKRNPNLHLLLTFRLELI